MYFTNASSTELWYQYRYLILVFCCIPIAEPFASWCCCCCDHAAKHPSFDAFGVKKTSQKGTNKDAAPCSPVRPDTFHVRHVCHDSSLSSRVSHGDSARPPRPPLLRDPVGRRSSEPRHISHGAKRAAIMQLEPVAPG